MTSGANGTFEIHLAWCDKVLVVEPDQSALAVLLASGQLIAPGCMTGGCGECATPYVEGDVVHWDFCLSEIDRSRYFCPCVSRAKTRIVLAL